MNDDVRLVIIGIFSILNGREHLSNRFFNENYLLTVSVREFRAVTDVSLESVADRVGPARLFR